MPSPTTVLLRTQTDERLVALTRAGHERAFEAIVERYRKPLVRACRRVLPEARAEDAVQQALVAAWTALSRGDEVRELRPWLYRIAHNTALNQLRIAGYDYDELHQLLDAGPAPEEELERREVARRTLTGLAALPPRQREALLQTAVHGRGQEEVARALGVSEPAVRQLVHRARTQLRAAATALTPMPLAGWLADLGARAAPMADRIGDVVTGGSAAGVAATAAKVGAVIVLAGGAAAGGPGVVERVTHGSRAGSDAQALRVGDAKAAEPVRAAAAATPDQPVALRLPAATPRTRPHAPHRSGRTGDGERSGPRGHVEDDHRDSRSGSSADDRGSRSGSSGDERGSGSGSSGDDRLSGGDDFGSGGSGTSGGSDTTSGGDDGATTTFGSGSDGSGSDAREPTSSSGESSGSGDGSQLPALTPTPTPASGTSGSSDGRDDALVDSSAD